MLCSFKGERERGKGLKFLLTEKEEERNELYYVRNEVFFQKAPKNHHTYKVYSKTDANSHFSRTFDKISKKVL